MAVLDDGSRNQHPIERTISWSLVISRVIEMVELEIDHARKRARLGSSFKDIVPMLRQVCKVADKRTRTHSLTHSLTHSQRRVDQCNEWRWTHAAYDAARIDVESERCRLQASIALVCQHILVVLRNAALPDFHAEYLSLLRELIANSVYNVEIGSETYIGTLSLA